MRTALIVVSKDPDIAKDVSGLSEIFCDGRIDLSVVEVIFEKDEARLKRRIAEFKDTVDVLVIADGTENIKIKSAVADALDAPLFESDNAKRFADAICKEKRIEPKDYHFFLPVESSVVPNLRGAYQGFILENDDILTAVLPQNVPEFKTMAESYLFPFLEKKYDLKRKRFVFKFFGDGEKLKKELDGARSELGVDFSDRITERYGDFTVELFFTESSESEFSAVLRRLVTALKDEIYAETDTTLSERLFDCLSVKNKKISVAESFTGGRVSAEIVKNSGVSAYFSEGIVSYSNESKESRLNVPADHLKREGAVSSVVAYDMAVGLLRTKRADVAVATTGIAGPNSDNTNKPVGLCYIAVGTLNGIHTYKYVFSGSREEITETAKNTALFLAIKNLKRM